MSWAVRPCGAAHPLLVMTAMKRIQRQLMPSPRALFSGPAFCALLWMSLGAGSLADPVRDFSVVDANTTSPRYGTACSPRDYLHQVSGYYFGNPG